MPPQTWKAEFFKILINKIEHFGEVGLILFGNLISVMNDAMDKSTMTTVSKIPNVFGKWLVGQQLVDV